MKKLLATALLALTLAPAAFATSPVRGPSFTHFANYDDGSRRYTGKSYSTLGHAQSAEVLIDGTTGLCFSGDPTHADLLIEQMVDIYNADDANVGAELALNDFAVIDNADPRLITLRFTLGQRTPAGIERIEFDSVRRCK